MIVLREDIKEKKGTELLERLGEAWSSFYKSILPMLLAIFYPIEQNRSVRTVTLLGFRDMVLLKTKIADALQPGSKASPDIKQMLLVLASVRETPPSENYLRLEQLVSRVVTPYLGTNGLCISDNNTPLGKRNSSDLKFNSGFNRERKLSVSMLKDEVTRKFRRSGSVTSSNNNDLSHSNKERSSFSRRFKIGDTSSIPPKPETLTTPETLSESTKTTEDSDMLAYLEERKQRWKNRDEMLISESLIG